MWSDAIIGKPPNILRFEFEVKKIEICCFERILFRYFCFVNMFTFLVPAFVLFLRGCFYKAFDILISTKRLTVNETEL